MLPIECDTKKVVMALLILSLPLLIANLTDPVRYPALCRDDTSCWQHDLGHTAVWPSPTRANATSPHNVASRTPRPSTIAVSSGKSAADSVRYSA